MISLTKRKESPAPAVDEVASVQAARTRARRRLVGAAVLVGIGIVGFPLLFETQPRPIAVDIPIEIPSKDNAPPLASPASRPPASTAPRPAPVAPAERVVAAPAEAPASAPVAAAPTAPPLDAAPSPVAAPAMAPPSTPAPVVAVAPPTRADAAVADRTRDAQRAQALLEGRAEAPAPPASAADAKAPRFVVQAGAYTDPAALREARQKVEKLGLKTYTQVVEVDGSSRTRVRVGPFATRDEAEKAAARIKTTGLAANILVL